MNPSFYPTVQLFLCLAAIVCIAWLVMKYLTPKSKESEAKSNVHLYYLVGIGSLLIIELVTYILTGVGEVSRVILDQISFASTISSILLSVIAIIYSIVSGSNGANLYVKTEEVSKQIGETLPKLGALGVAVEKLEMLDATAQELKDVPSAVEVSLEEIKAQMLRMEELSRKMSQKLDNVAYDVSEMSMSQSAMLNAKQPIVSDSQVESRVSDDKSGGSNKDITELYQRYVIMSSFWGKLLLLACCYSYETGKSFSLRDELFSADVFPAGYLYGYLIASWSIGIISVQRNGDDLWSVTRIYKAEGFNLKEQVLVQLSYVINELIKTVDEKESYRKNMREVQEYFGVETK